MILMGNYRGNLLIDDEALMRVSFPSNEESREVHLTFKSGESMELFCRLNMPEARAMLNLLTDAIKIVDERSQNA